MTAASYASSASGFASYLVADEESAKTYFGLDTANLEAADVEAAAQDTAFKTFDAIKEQI